MVRHGGSSGFHGGGRPGLFMFACVISKVSLGFDVRFGINHSWVWGAAHLVGGPTSPFCPATLPSRTRQAK